MSNRLTYADLNGDGEVTPGEIIEENNYYPFGLKHQGYNELAGDAHKYKFLNREHQPELGLNTIATDYRHYDAAMGRFNNMDALSELAPSQTPYRYGFNNPVYWTDPTGLFENRSAAFTWANTHLSFFRIIDNGDSYSVWSGGVTYYMFEGMLVYDFYAAGSTVLDAHMISGISPDGLPIGGSKGGGGGSSSGSSGNPSGNGPGGPSGPGPGAGPGGPSNGAGPGGVSGGTGTSTPQGNSGAGILDSYLIGVEGIAKVSATREFKYGTATKTAEQITSEYAATMKSVSKIARAGGHLVSVGEIGYGVYQDGGWGYNANVATGGAIGGTIGAWGGAKAGAAAGAVIGSFIPILGTGAGAVIGGIVGGIVGSQVGSDAGKYLVRETYNY